MQPNRVAGLYWVVDLVTRHDESTRTEGRGFGRTYATVIKLTSGGQFNRIP